MPFDSDGERRRERITRSCGNREALPLDRLWKAEQIGGCKGISTGIHGGYPSWVNTAPLIAGNGGPESRLAWLSDFREAVILVTRAGAPMGARECPPKLYGSAGISRLKIDSLRVVISCSIAGNV